MQRKLFGLIFSLAMLAQMSAAIAQTNRTWNPAGGPGNWGDPTRWTGGVVPGENDNAIITFNGGIGIVNVNESFAIGNLTFLAGNTLDLGAAGTTLTINRLVSAATGTIRGSGHLIVGGEGAHSWTTATFAGTGAVRGSTTFSAGTLTIGELFTAPQVSGWEMNTAGTTFWTDVNSALTLSNSTWNNSGTFTRNQASGSIVDGQLNLNGNSTFNNLSTGTFTQAGSIASTVSGGTFNNRGIVVSASASGLTFSGTVNNIRDLDNPEGGIMRTNGGSLTLSGPIITNSGEIRAEGGDITITGNFTNNGGDLVALGTNSIIINSGTYTHNGGRLFVDGGNIAGTAALTINTVGEDIGGIVGVGTINQNVTMNAGTYIAPGNSAGSLSFLGTLAMTDSTLRIEVGGAFPGDWDTITVAGNATLTNVTVEASTINGFVPTSLNQEFLFFTAANDLAGLVLAPSSVFNLELRGNQAFLVSAVPEPSSLALLGLCTGLGLFARKRRAVASI